MEYQKILPAMIYCISRVGEVSEFVPKIPSAKKLENNTLLCASCAVGVGRIQQKEFVIKIGMALS